MNCLCEKSKLIYSDHTTGYIDIEWCPRCGRVVLTDQDETTVFIPTVSSQPVIEADAEIRGMCPVCGRALVMGVCETECGHVHTA